MNYKDKIENIQLKENLLKLDQRQLKLFYGMLVHYWVKYKYFISSQSFVNLWCELNLICSEVDEGFPDPYDHELIKSYCQAHPYYFIDILEPDIVINLFCEYLDDKLDLLATIARKLHTGGLRDAYKYSNSVLNLTDDIDESIAQAEEHVKMFS